MRKVELAIARKADPERQEAQPRQHIVQPLELANRAMRAIVRKDSDAVLACPNKQDGQSPG